MTVDQEVPRGLDGAWILGECGASLERDTRRFEATSQVNSVVTITPRTPLTVSLGIPGMSMTPKASRSPSAEARLALPLRRWSES